MHGSSASTRSIGEPSCNMCWSCSSTNKPSTLKFSGKELGRQHQMPSVSSSRGVPSCSTSLAALCSRSSQLFRLYQQANTSLYQLIKQSINQSIKQSIKQKWCSVKAHGNQAAAKQANNKPVFTLMGTLQMIYMYWKLEEYCCC